MRRFARSAPLHFVAIGVALTLLRMGFAPAPAPPPIVIANEDVELLVRDWRAAMGREPTPDELEQRIQDRVDEELLLREATAAGLHRSDALAVRRLIQLERFLEGPEGDAERTDRERLDAAIELGLERRDLIVRRRLLERMRTRIAVADRRRAARDEGEHRVGPVARSAGEAQAERDRRAIARVLAALRRDVEVIRPARRDGTPAGDVKRRPLGTDPYLSES